MERKDTMPNLPQTTLNKLANVQGQALADLMAQACTIRDIHWGRRITYSRKVFIPLTNMCRDTCGYCTFVQHPDSPKAQLMTPEEVMRSLRAAQRLGCKEALFSLGEKPERRYPQAAAMLAKLGYQSTTDYLRDICALTLSETALIPHINAGTLDDKDIRLLKPVSGSMGMMLESLSLRLMQKGGPHYQCPDKAPKLRMATLHAAGKQQVPFTTGLLIGIGETWEERIEALQAINEVHQQYGHIQEVIIQNFRAKPGTAMANAPEPDLTDMLRTLAVARLILDPTISLQAPPNLASEHLRYLEAGINDFGGISPVSSDYINPERAWPALEQLQQEVASAGYQLQERLTVYPQHIESQRGKISPAVQAHLTSHAREDGLACVQLF
ncbi:7,8-didemethyl-8-hydroxy-5-deazariboflavin synthase CofG [Porticoccaceae bacterium]|nr:7,8-didemethyl-8-hydroxy-5-deazariboflavin synthase CofG [Porticoccaceae bacterium]